MTPSAEPHDAPPTSLYAKTLTLLKRLYESQFIRHASLSLLLNSLSKVLAFFASAFAAKCMGALNYGISGVAHTAALQISVLYQLGLDTVATRRIAANKYADSTRALVETIITLRVCLASVMMLIWDVAVWFMVDEPRRTAWWLASLILWLNASFLHFVFMGIEKMPVLNGIQALATTLSAIGIFLIFKPGAPAGLDLAFTSASTAVVVALSWLAYWREFGRAPISLALFRTPRALLPELLSESWKYFLMALVTGLFTFFQVPIVEMLSNTREAGIYRTAFSLILGLDFFLQSFYLLLLPRVVVWKEQGLEVLLQQQRRALWLFGAVSTPIALLAWFASPVFYDVFLGPEFAVGAEAFRILAIARLTGFIAQVYVQTLVAMKRDIDFLIISIIGSATSIGLSIVFIPNLGALGAAWSAATGEVLINIASVIWVNMFQRNVR
ncbi:MAG: oligosaccharide flippase family protein [Candidatus Thermochlorobacter sp.]